MNVIRQHSAPRLLACWCVPRCPKLIRKLVQFIYNILHKMDTRFLIAFRLVFIFELFFKCCESFYNFRFRLKPNTLFTNPPFVDFRDTRTGGGRGGWGVSTARLCLYIHLFERMQSARFFSYEVFYCFCQLLNLVLQPSEVLWVYLYTLRVSIRDSGNVGFLPCRLAPFGVWTQPYGAVGDENKCEVCTSTRSAGTKVFGFQSPSAVFTPVGIHIASQMYLSVFARINGRNFRYIQFFDFRYLLFRFIDFVTVVLECHTF